MPKKSVPVQAQSIAVAACVTADATNNHVVVLPQGNQHLGFEIQGSPPMISAVAKDSPVYDQLQVGNYIHGLIMPAIEIFNLTDPVHLAQLLEVNVNNPRHIIVSTTPFYVDPAVGKPVSGALYKHRLPVSKDLGIFMQRFPPVITFVMAHSALAGRLHPGQTVEALIVPGAPIMNLAAGAFTSTKVEARLLATCHLDGRQLVVKDGGQPVQREKGSSRALDDCVIS